MIRTAIYMRVSTVSQAQEGDSIPAQRDALRHYIDSHSNMTFVGEYLDDGITGTKDTRPELQRMIADVKAGMIDMILVTKMDRLHRSLRNFLNMQDTLDKYHCNWLAIWEPMYDTSTPQGRMVINTMMNLAQFEAEQTGQRIRQVFDYKISQGEVTNGKIPVGYSIANRHLVPNEDADTVREVFEYYSRYGNLAQTVKKFGGTHSLPTTSVAFKNILTTTKYIGVFKGNDNYCPPIIDRDLFEDVQRKLSMNVTEAQTRVYIFSGLVVCAECGGKMSGVTYRRSPGGIVYKKYRCTRHYAPVVKCVNGAQPYEVTIEKNLIGKVREQLTGIVIHAETGNLIVKDNTAKVAAVNRKIERLKDLYVNDLISLEEYRHDREQLEKERDALAAQNVPVTRDVSALKELLAQPFETLYADFTDDQKRYFWRSIIKNITVTDGRHFREEYL